MKAIEVRANPASESKPGAVLQGRLVAGLLKAILCAMFFIAQQTTGFHRLCSLSGYFTSYLNLALKNKTSYSTAFILKLIRNKRKQWYTEMSRQYTLAVIKVECQLSGAFCGTYVKRLCPLGVCYTEKTLI